MIHIVLVEPEIPFNTGAIGRTCVALGARLHLIGPLGFSLDEKARRRAGLDYWQHLDYQLYPNAEAFWQAHPQITPYFLTTKGGQTYSKVHFEDEPYLFFGKESAGLPEAWLRAHLSQCLRIPMSPGTRSLNLSNAVAIVAYEVARQQHFEGLAQQGHLPEVGV